MKSFLRLFLLGFGLLFIGLGIEGFRLVYFAMQPHLPGAQDSTLIEVTRGETPRELAELLQKGGIISDENRFLQLGRFTRAWSELKAGEYRVSASMPPLEILRVLRSGISVPRVFTIKEGTNIYEIADQMEAQSLMSKKEFLKLVKSQKFIESLELFSKSEPIPNSLEGYLFPETYHFSKTQPSEEMIREMVKTFLNKWTTDLDLKAQELNFSRHQVVTLASIIEKETGATEERPLISSVFHNRLRKHMRLQSDPTTIYGIWSRYRGNLKKSDLLETTPYNTYAIPALPMGPIGNPGVESIKAAVFPTESPFLYFVSENDGTHRFSKTFEEHSRAVQRYQLDPKAREGKSWRDLKKRKPEAATN